MRFGKQFAFALVPTLGDGRRSNTAWGFLSVAGLLEVGWAIGLKYTQGFSRLWPSVLDLLPR